MEADFSRPTMDDHTLRVLEFDKILETIASYALSAPGREAVLASRPLTDASAIRREETLVTEVKDALVSTGRFPLEGFRDIREELRRVRPDGSRLPGEALRQIVSFLAGNRTFRNFVAGLETRPPRLLDLASELRLFPEVEKRIRTAVDEDGEILDAATPALLSIRREMRSLDERIRSLLEEYIHAPDMEERLQEKFVTLRDGRHVLPVKADRKKEVPGILHGRSDTGNTIFVEPAPAVELGNERRDLAGQEEAEVRRILASLSGDVRAVLPELAHNLGVFAQADAARAKASLSIAHDMKPARVTDEGLLEILQGRHPLIVFGGSEAVPLDLSLSAPRRMIVISGPNTGGKTVALKTVGLLCLMAQAGFHVPAGERSRFPVFRKILADIGDEQSIEASLSTFSSHLSRLVEVLDTVEAGSLVLLDEMGAATDPVEGGALAAAILESLLDTGAFCLATTHITAVKAVAHDREGAGNAAMEFDEATGRPTYRLKTGVPGSSHALATARALGLAPAVVEKAERLLGEDRAAMERLLEDLRERTEEARRDRDEADALREAAEADRRRVEARLAGVEKEKKEILKKAHLEAGEILQAFRVEGERVLDRIKEIRKARPAPGAKEKARVEQRRLSELGRRARAEAKRLAPAPQEASGEPVKEGQTVALKSMQGFGTVRRLDGKKGRAEVALGGLTFDVKLEDLIPVKKEEVRRASSRRREADLDLRPPPSRELNLLGMRVEPALEAVERFLDEAVLADLEEVRIVHGFGTGALQKAVSERLRGHPSVASHRPGGKGEGGEGATVVTLR